MHFPSRTWLSRGDCELFQINFDDLDEESLVIPGSSWICRGGFITIHMLFLIRLWASRGCSRRTYRGGPILLFGRSVSFLCVRRVDLTLVRLIVSLPFYLICGGRVDLIIIHGGRTLLSLSREYVQSTREIVSLCMSSRSKKWQYKCLLLTCNLVFFS